MRSEPRGLFLCKGGDWFRLSWLWWRMMASETDVTQCVARPTAAANTRTGRPRGKTGSFSGCDTLVAFVSVARSLPDATRFSAIGILPGHAPWVTAGCEALGTM